jgi:hypothetical protein
VAEVLRVMKEYGLYDIKNKKPKVKKEVVEI